VRGAVGKRLREGEPCDSQACFVWGWMLVYRAEFEAVQLRLYDR
jgi:hypothetical protein